VVWQIHDKVGGVLRRAAETRLAPPACLPKFEPNQVLGCSGAGPARKTNMLLVSAIALAASILIGVLILYCCSMVRDVNEAQEEFRHRLEQFYQVATMPKGVEHNAIVQTLHHQALPFRRILQHIAD